MTRASIARLIDDIQWQKIITTYSGSLVGGMSLSSLRRLTLAGGVMAEHCINMADMSGTGLRRLGYHLGLHSRTAWFARVWLLVEGESEMWLLPQLARLMGVDFGAEGIHCIEFAQSGLGSLVKAAQQLGIEWHVLTDGDHAGKAYIKKVKQVTQQDSNPEEPEQNHWTMLSERDIEHCFWRNGYAQTFQQHAQITPHLSTPTKPEALKPEIKPGRMIKLAINRHSKPDLALKIVEAVAAPGSPGMPGVIKNLIETCVLLARRTAVRSKTK